ncbi:transcriptional regulator, CdaR family [Halobacillus alkaliphilus]|uniref:Transcriptional regulator, CdaR family n=1 Tax=Halobacillus alkaliphilus TaxID=396056 RepID=A0A1I2L3X9_9BACI|nr:sugar diacid recognition domain-containing protein [Halobacillus alkaliphilus]SFF73190.1 transcriptional regulator, CdaR family [Halobacillus alkaliphilus]
MLIPKEVAQSIVHETESIMNRNINFMDEEAKIIASLNPDRIGDFHEGAAEVLRTKQKIVISSNETYQGAKPGINLPVRLHEQVVGVIGITGDPEEVNQLGSLLQRMTEILIKEAYLEEQVELENQARETFVKEWVSNRFDDEKLFAARGWMFGINIYKSRVAVLLEMSGFQEYWHKRIEKSDVDVKEELNLQRYRRALESLISQHFPEKNEHVLIPNGSSSYMLLLSVDEHKENQKQKNLITYRIKEIQQALEVTYKQKSVAGVGSLCGSPGELWRSVEEAERALRFGVDHQRPLYYFEDLGVEAFMYDLSESFRQDFIQRKLRPSQLKLIPDCLHTLEIFYKNNGSIKDTAEVLHIHKNTLQYRIKKIGEVTGYDPRNINDSTLIQIALAFYKIT